MPNKTNGFSFVNVTGAIFEQGTDEIQSAFKYALDVHHKQNNTGRKSELQVLMDIINTADAFKLSRLSKYFGSFTNIIISINDDTFEFTKKRFNKQK